MIKFTYYILFVFSGYYLVNIMSLSPIYYIFMLAMILFFLLIIKGI